MLDVVDWFFQISGQLWTLIVSSWVLSLGVLISLFSWVITLINGSTHE